MTEEDITKIVLAIQRHENRVDSLRRAWPEFDSDVDYHNREIAELSKKLPIIDFNLPF